jgi:hypothetical protein
MNSGFAQKARSESATINSQKYSGYSIIIADDTEKVSDFWLNELKSKGKIRRKRDFFQIGELKLPDEYYPEALYYTRIINRDSISSKIWIALNPETLLAGENGKENVNLALENYVSSLETEYDRYLIQLQIADAERAVTFTSRQKQRLIQNGKNLQYQLEESKAEKERLLESIEMLELEILALAQKIENNKGALDQADIDLDKINKMMETYRQNLRKLGN